MGKDYQRQVALNQQQIDAQKEENQLDRDFQSAQWLEHFNMQNQYNEEYNSPSAQVARYQAAGINPALAMGEGSATQSTAANPSTPSGGHGLSGLNNVASPTNFPEILNSISHLNDTFGQLFKNGAEGQQALRMTKPLVDSAVADKEYKELMSVWQDYQNFVSGSTLNTQVAKANNEVLVMIQQAYSYKSQGDLNKAEEELSKARKLLTQQQERHEGYQADYSSVVASRALDIIQSGIDQSKASAAASYASARADKARAYAQEFENEIRDDNRDAVVKRVRSEAQNAANVSHLTDAQRKLVHWLSEKAHKESDLVTIKAYAEMIHMFVGDVINSVSEFTKVGALNKLGDAKQREVEAKEREFNATQVKRDVKKMDSRTGDVYLEHETYYR